ncbi:hypothetical protein GCM10010168_47310 [Actinoplanes ianthinogenes]|uniref:Integral membrane protein n=1 Tax=Actinoplanes ianthinogenes TaxID=122358 RepID=A0ABM7LP30_9ACTN|nr:hypothetical protein [Actinoplanes ianthinogenes]BCJ40970.1 hypothetical protein Aiant_16270 [Actinoplanes ianthinogenes]GGR23846.1 hypothetical protein GCM10010168_47310 [Actinoplanes ianthinogenes]
MTDLERRYSRLVRWFYPAAYHRERGTEIVGTYLELAGPDQRRPAVADIADLAAGGFREHVRAAGATALVPGLRLAGALAMITLAAIAAAGVVAEVADPRAGWHARAIGPYSMINIAVWVSWLLAVAVHAITPGRRTRLALAAALSVTAAVVPLADYRPPLYMLVPQAVLGLVALAAGRQPRLIRAAPALAAAATITYMGSLLWHGDPWDPVWFYISAADEFLPLTAITLLLTTLLLATALATRGDLRGGWTLLALITPIGLLVLHPLTAVITSTAANVPNPTWSSMAAVAIALTLLPLLLLALAAPFRRRPATPRPTCPTCGGHLPEADHRP